MVDMIVLWQAPLEAPAHRASTQTKSATEGGRDNIRNLVRTKCVFLSSNRAVTLVCWMCKGTINIGNPQNPCACAEQYAAMTFYTRVGISLQTFGGQT